jgi:hypothetical protein
LISSARMRNAIAARRGMRPAMTALAAAVMGLRSPARS